MLANQPKNDTLYIKGFNIVVENRAFTYRQVAQNVGQKACLMPAHYGYLQNNPKMGVFVGAFPESDTVYLINQKAQGGYFDKHIAMFGFLSEQQAVDTYQKCFEYGYIGLMSVIPCTIEQLKWWLINGDKSRPVTKERLPYAGLERLDSVSWNDDKLCSHSGQVSKLLYQIRQSDSFNHALEPLSYHDLTQELGNQGFVYENYDALVTEYNKLERKAKQMLMAMQGAADVVKPVGVAVSKPLTKGGVANVVAWFEMEDGQAVGVFFHNPDKTPKKIDPTDEMISYKWVLNKKDITIVVAPENGKDLVVRTVAKRIMKLVDANHDRFLKANSDKAELNLKEQELNAEVIAKQAELDALNKEIEALEAQKAEKEANKPVIEQTIEQEQVSSDLANLSFVRDDFDKQKYLLVDNNGKQYQTIFKSGSSWAMNSGESFKTLVEAKQAAIDNAKFWMKMQQEEAASRAEVEAMSKEKSDNKISDPAEKEANKLEQERPSNWRTNLANARAVAKSLGIETKGKKLDGLVKEIDIFEENEIKKQVLAEFVALKSRLVLPMGYVLDLREAEKSIGDLSYPDVSAFINKVGNVDKNDVQYVELRVSPRKYPWLLYGYTFAGNRNNPKVKDSFQRFPQSEEYSTAKDLILDIEKFLIDKIFPEIEYQKVKNSIDIDVVDLPSLGVATITNVGSENINIEKDGKYYISKVGNPQLYALGEWDFAKYPDGMVTQKTEPPQPASEPPMTKPKTGDTKQDIFTVKKKTNASGGFWGDFEATNEKGDIAVFLPKGFTKGLSDGMVVKATALFEYGRWKLQKVDEIISDPLKAERDEKERQEKESYKKPEINPADAMNFLYEMDANKVDSITLKEGFGNSTTYSREEVMAVINKLRGESNPDRDYLQSIIDGSMTPKSSDMDVVIALTGKYETDEDMIPLLEQALEKINQTQQAAVKEVA